METVVDYRPPLRFGIPERSFREAVVTRPRFAPQVVLARNGDLIFQDMTKPTCDDGQVLCNESAGRPPGNNNGVGPGNGA